MIERGSERPTEAKSMDADDLLREEILMARATPAEVKVVLGLRLWEQAVMLAREGVRHALSRSGEAPSDEAVERALEARLLLFRDERSSETPP
jgi:hypothetical protein